MLDASQDGDSYRRIEVITGHSRRPTDEKARIVAESNANISEVVRRGACRRVP
jgi:transposase